MNQKMNLGGAICKFVSMKRCGQVQRSTSFATELDTSLDKDDLLQVCVRGHATCWVRQSCMQLEVWV